MPTPAQNRAKTKYRAKAYDQINMQVPKGSREKYRTQAAAHSMSLNAYIISLLEADAARAPDSAIVVERALD